ncbi:hypothetical protein [Haloarchaeobius sp. HRN-SO-5]|uniref:hypothetical protein n=1 Tax=Haloarchaeobius sp. HRN-SO-5 TaxID=3446118 RepID=UPI003EBC7F62
MHTTNPLGRPNRPSNGHLLGQFRGIALALLAVTTVVLAVATAVTLVPELTLAAGLAVWAALVVGVVAAPFGLVHVVGELL